MIKFLKAVDEATWLAGMVILTVMMAAVWIPGIFAIAIIEDKVNENR